MSTTDPDIAIIETSSLGDRSYLISHDGIAVVIDPQRDIDRVLALATEKNAAITHVLETHIHNDYVTGGLELARATGAEYVVPEGDPVEFERRAVGDGDVVDAGSATFQVMHTPGHTHHHVSYVLQLGDEPIAIFTGGSMLYGSTGRTDLLGSEHTDELTHAQFHSVRRIAAELPADVEVYPTHGFGSFCSATPTSGDSSTIGEQQQSNPALTQDEQTYVDELIAGLSAYPAYYAHMGVINTEGPAPIDLSTPEPVDPDELRRRIDDGQWVVDLRARTAFAAGHLDGSLGFELSTTFVTYLGWLYQWGAPLTLIGDTSDQIDEATRELARIGIDHPSGSAVGEIHSLASDGRVRSYEV
ncbi:MBL fold metallo-hydrolase, partial [Rhodococcoides fascians]